MATRLLILRQDSLHRDSGPHQGPLRRDHIDRALLICIPHDGRRRDGRMVVMILHEAYPGREFLLGLSARSVPEALLQLAFVLWSFSLLGNEQNLLPVNVCEEGLLRGRL